MSSPQPAVPEYAELSAALSDPETLVRAVAGGVLRGSQAPRLQRVELRYVDLKSGRVLQAQGFDATQAHTSNHAGAEISDAVAQLLALPYSHWHVESTEGTVAIRVNKKGKAVVQRDKRRASVAPDRAHDRTKSRRLESSDPVFAALGVTTGDGQVKPTRRDKFTQVQDFLQAMDPVLEAAIRAAGDGPVHVVDQGCGNAYLTFAAYRYLTQVRGVAVRMTGIDSKQQSREHNTAVAEKIGAAADFNFVQGWIGQTQVTDPVHLVIALHACDTATDDALAQAVRWQAPVIVAAPCCHHDIQKQLDAATIPLAYQPIARHGILRERLADLLTDSFRAALLREHGYRTDVIEFVDSKHTPRNALIRAVRTGAAVPDADLAAYTELRDAWGVQPRLEQLLADSSPADTGVTQH
ncbi:class I SAM-dependent methyltransferase [Dermacoccaceae bacterium W4C1]